MNNIILDYNDYYEDYYEYSRKGSIGNVKKRVYKEPNDINKFFGEFGYCPFCKKHIPKVFDKHEHRVLGIDIYADITIWECDFCGWWQYYYTFSEEKDFDDSVSSQHNESLKHAIVKKFNIDSNEIPINTLMQELLKKQDNLYNINPHKLEDIAQVVFSSYYNCEVKHVGKTGDGGIDLIIVESDNPILVQVKRRENSEHVELVKGIREFVGTMYINDATKGIYLSTAKRFSKASKETAKELIENRKFEYFELIDYERFCSMLNVVKRDTLKPWKKIAESFE